MLLSVQIQAILFQLLAGWLYGLFFSLIQVLTQYRQRRVSTTLVEVLFHAGFTAVLFFALLQLCRRLHECLADAVLCFRRLVLLPVLLPRILSSVHHCKALH